LYLKSDVYRISGTGTISDPYIIGKYIDPNAIVYWNDDFSGKTYAVGSTPTTTYTSLSSQNYIKTTSKEHQVCSRWSFTGKEFCLGTNYWDTNGSTTMTKLQSEMASALGMSTSDLECSSSSVGASCYVIDDFLECSVSEDSVSCSDVMIEGCSVSTNYGASCSKL
jgi:hypothetical protein